MSTIAATIGYGGGVGLRSQVSGDQWTEAKIAFGGGLALPARIGSTTEVIRVLEWIPADAETDVQHGQPVSVNIEAANTTESEMTWEDPADFDTGIHDGTVSATGAIGLGTVQFIEDWEGVTPLDNWTQRTTKGVWSIYSLGSPINSMIVREDGKSLTSVISSDDFGDHSAVIVQSKMRFRTTGNMVGLCVRLTGSGTALRGYYIRPYVYSNTWGVTLFRLTGDGSAAFIFPFETKLEDVALTDTSWITIKYMVTADHLHYVKGWRLGEAEPGTWKGAWLHSLHPGPGSVGLIGSNDLNSNVNLYDDFVAETIPPQYNPSGVWTSGKIDLTSIISHSHSELSWEETKPANTSIVVSVRWPNGEWLTPTNGGALPQIGYGADMTAGASRDELEIKVELDTTDTSVSPEVDNIRLFFSPLHYDDIDVIVNGESNTILGERLAKWGRALVSGVYDPTDWGDLWFQTRPPYLAADNAEVEASLEYKGIEIDAITFTAEDGKHRAAGHPIIYWMIPITPYYSAGIIEYTTLREWFQMAKEWTWNIIDKGSGIHGDVRYLVGHGRLDDAPMSFLLAIPITNDHPLSAQVYGYKRDTHVMSMMIQGWQRDNAPLSVTVGRWTVNDQPVSAAVGIRYLNEHPLSLVVYGVSREGMIEVNIIDDNTWSTLSGLGFSRS